MYSKITTPVPRAKLSGTVRLGFFTSLAAKVTLFHASEEKRAPTITPPITISAGSNVPSGTRSCTDLNLLVCSMPLHKSAMLSCQISDFAATKMPSKMSRISAPVLATVKTFCTSRPALMPRELMKVSSRMTSTATIWPLLILKAPRSSRMNFSPSSGTSTPRNLANATATAAMVPV